MALPTSKITALGANTCPNDQVEIALMFDLRRPIKRDNFLRLMNKEVA